MRSTKTREEMIEILRRGETVTYQGNIIRNFADIPSEAELSKGNTAAEEEAKKNILAEMQRLQAEFALLEPAKEAPAEDKAPAKTAKKADAAKESE